MPPLILWRDHSAGRYDWGKIRILYVIESLRNREQSAVETERTPFSKHAQWPRLCRFHSVASPRDQSHVFWVLCSWVTGMIRIYWAQPQNLASTLLPFHIKEIIYQLKFMSSFCLHIVFFWMHWLLSSSSTELMWCKVVCECHFHNWTKHSP